MLKMQSLSKVYRTEMIETYALRDFNLQVREGEFVAVTGPSGSGKTTFLTIAGLLEAFSGGRYELDGIDVSGMDDTQRSRMRNEKIGFIFQAFNLIADLTVEENVALPLTYRDGAERGRIRQRVREVLELVGMHHRHKHYPGQLSGGQQQRVAVARALAGNPSILLADEPTGNLDTRNGEAVMQLLEQLHDNGTTLCMVTHDAAFARRAQRIVHMLDGRIVDEDTFERLRHEQDVVLPARAAEQAR